MDKELEEYSKFINNCLSDLGITRSEAGKMFARIAGISEETGKDLIYRYCQGTRRPGRGNAIFLAEMLGLSVDEVLNGKKSVAITPTLRTTFKQRGYTLERYIEKLNHVVEFSTPLRNHDEFGKDALDYAIENKNNDAIKYLIKHDICEFDNLYTEITHSCKEKGNVKLSELFNIARCNNDEELLEIIYPKANKYILVDNEEEPELYVTKLNTKEMRYFVFENDSLNNVYTSLRKHFLESFNLDEKIFERRNKTLLKNKELMRLSSFNMHTNILVNYAGNKMFPLFFEKVNEFNALLLDHLQRLGIKAEELKLEKDGRLFYLDNGNEYWITTLGVISDERIHDAFDTNPIAYTEYRQTIDLKTYMEFVKEYYENYELVRKDEFPVNSTLTKMNAELLANHFWLKKESKGANLSKMEDENSYCFHYVDLKDNKKDIYVLIDKISYKYEIFEKPTHEQEVVIKHMKEYK